jgi:hypothetical protein
MPPAPGIKTNDVAIFFGHLSESGLSVQAPSTQRLTIPTSRSHCKATNPPWLISSGSLKKEGFRGLPKGCRKTAFERKRKCAVSEKRWHSERSSAPAIFRSAHSVDRCSGLNWTSDRITVVASVFIFFCAASPNEFCTTRHQAGRWRFRIDDAPEWRDGMIARLPSIDG